MRGPRYALSVSVLGWFLLLAWGTMPRAACAQTVRVSAPERVEAESGMVISLPVRVVATGEMTLRLDPVLPPGWSILIPPPAMSMSPGTPATRIVSIQIPSSAAAGVWRVAFRVRGQPDDTAAAGPGAEGSLPAAETEITVTERTSLTLSLVDAPSRVRAGAPVEATFAIENTGNHTASFRIEAESSLQYDTRVAPDLIELEPSARSQVQVQARTRDDLVNELTHVLRIRAQEEGERGTGEESRATTQIVPVRRPARRLEEGQLPVLFTVRGTTESGRSDAQAEFEIPATRVGDRVYSARLRGPDMRSNAAFGERDEYAAQMEGRHIGLRMGDQDYRLSDLLDTSFFAFGGELSLDRDRVQGAAFASRTRHVFPETGRAGAYVHLWPHQKVAVELNALTREKFEPGEAASIATRWLPVDGAELAAEVAHGWYDIGEGSALQLSAQGSFPWIVFSGRAETADPFFLGGIQNSERLQSSFAVRGNHWIRIEGLGRAERRFFDASRSRDRALENRLFRGGAGGSFSLGNNRLQTMLVGQFQDRRVAETGLDRQEKSVALRLNFNSRGFGLNASGETGRIVDDGFSEGTFSSVSGSAFKVMRAFSLSLTASYLEGITFFSPREQERVTVGSTLSFDAGRGLSASASAFRSRETGAFSQTFTLFDARVAASLWSNHELELRARGSQTSFSSDVRTGTFSLAYRIPFSVRAPFSGERTQTTVSFRVFDVETGEPLKGVVFVAGRTRADSDSDGLARLVLTGGEQFVLLDQESIGLDRMPTVPFPIEVGAVSQGVTDVGIVRSSRLSVRVEAGRRQTELDAALGSDLDRRALSGLVVEARMGENRFRRLTDEEGRAQFPPLVPGLWEVFLLDRSLPENYRTAPESALVELIPGGVGETVFRLEPAERRIRFVTSGTGVSVGVPGKAIGAQAAPGADAAPAPAGDGNDDMDGTEMEDAEMYGRTVRVKQGDTLFSLARQHYESQWHWVRIWLANRDVLELPDLVPAGTVLRLPATGPLTEEEWRVIRRQGDE